jgi:hypothetical protein
MTRSSFCAIALLFTAACESTLEPEAVSPPPTVSLARGAAPVALVNGSFHRSVSTDELPDPELQQSVTLSAQLLADGSVRGQVRLRLHRPDGTLLVDLFEEVTCLVVDGHTAWIGTVVVREHLSPGRPSRLGRPEVWQVRDLGVGNDFVQRRPDAPDCHARPELDLVPTLHGDLHVEDRR